MPAAMCVLGPVLSCNCDYIKYSSFKYMNRIILQIVIVMSCLKVKVKLKVKQSHYRPGEALRVPGG
jgi:hypothetical protein